MTEGPAIRHLPFSVLVLTFRVTKSFNSFDVANGIDQRLF